METAIDVQLLTHTPDPVRVMYVAFRTCYSRFTPQEIWADIESGKISEEKMKTFIFDKLKSGHSSPRTQIYFTFAVSGLSRAASHQLVRHNNGITYDQQSQRYYAFKEADFPFVVPETWEQAGLRDEYLAFMHRVGELYDQALKAEFPELAKPVQPKCGDQRLGYCDEPMAEYLKCPLGARRIRLHKDEIVAAAKAGRTLESSPLSEEDLSLLTPKPEFEKVLAGTN